MAFVNMCLNKGASPVWEGGGGAQHLISLVWLKEMWYDMI